jgi:hypothetical protein
VLAAGTSPVILDCPAIKRSKHHARGQSEESTLAAIIGVAGMAFEARIAAGKHTRAICSSDGKLLATSLACAITPDCRGLISFGIAGGLSPGDVRRGINDRF